MKEYLPLNRRVDNEHGASVTIVPRRTSAEVEVGTDTGYIRIAFADPNALRAIAGHLMTVADEIQRKQQGAGR